MTPLFQVLGFQIVFILSVLADSRNYVCPDPETCTSWSCISNVPPTPPEQLAVWPVSSTELTATWNITQCGFRPFTDYICSVQYFSQWDDIARTTEVRVERPHYGSASLGDLTPFTFYRLRVRCMKILDRTWSGYTPFAQGQTNATAPGSAVNVQTPVTVSINYRTGRRNVTVTWEPLPLKKHNGVLLGYLVRVTDLRVPSRVVVLNTTVNETACTLEQLKMSGYRVNITAYNSEGETPETTVEIRDMARVPDQPLDLKAEVSPDGNITLAWQPPSEIGGIEQYTVYWCELEMDTTCRGGNENELSVPGTYTMTDLIDSWLPFRRYRFTVRALTSAGQGPPSDNTYKYTVEGVPSSPPTNVNAQAENGTTLRVSWLPPPLTNRRGLITAYNLYITCMQNFQDTIWIAVNVANDSRPAHSLVTDLKPFTRYSVRVSARTVAGEGNMSEPVFGTTKQSAPGSALNVQTPVTVSRNYRTGRRNVTVTWEPLPLKKHNGILLGYLVRVTDLRVPSRVVVLNTTVNDTICTLEQLKLSGYRVNITAYNTEGESPETTVEIRDEARDLKAEVNTDGNITLAWQPPAEIGGIEQYTVFWCELETDTTCRGGNESALSVPGTYTMTTLIDSWLPFRRYRFNVRALTSAGQGPPSDNTYKYTVEGVPSSPPTNVNAQAENATTLRVSWLPVPLTNRRGLITAYTVYITCMQNFQGTTLIAVKVVNDSQPARSLVPDLKPFTRYSVRVSARTVAGEGNMSEPVFGTTKQSAPSGPPENVTIANITTNSFVISWSPPKHPNGIILHYNIRLKNKVMGFGNQTEGSLWGLKDGTNYSVQVQACTGAEESPCGPYSPLKYAQTLKRDNVEPAPMDQSHGAVIAGATLGSVFVLILMFIAVVSAPKLRQTCRRISYIPKPKDFITEELPATNGKSTPSLDQLYLVTDKAKMAPEIVDNVMDLKTFELEPHDSQSEVETSDVDIKENCGLVDSDEEDYLKVVEVKDRFQDLDVIYVPKTGITKREGVS
ncbi:PREDICTED: protein sidekick-1-like [Branchiostoma belcheri]|uniref:Protein sidekick-1-like n=1 Tax=Branchiostoma belcheri TaxID=7741 RepID=A0A6P4ZYU8_BRABE|nr:PREDICTED: protein sidekick-1-like [Branchiostoma belcheri]